MSSLADNKHISSFFTKKRNLSVFLFFLIINLALCSGHIGGDGFYIYLTAESLVLDGDTNLINVPPDFDITEQKRSYDNVLEAVEKRKADGKDDFYSYYGLAMVLGEAPFYLIGHLAHKIFPVVKHDYMTMFSVSLLNCFISALLGLYIYLFALRISGSEKRSFLLSCAVMFGTFLFAYALKSGYSEPMMTLTIFASFYHAFRFRETDDKMQLIFSGLYGGAAINSKFYGFLVIGMVGIYVIRLAYKKASGSNRLTIIGHFSAAFAIGLAAFLIYNYIRFGSILETGYTSKDGVDVLEIGFLELTPSHFIARAFYLLLSPGKGLFIFAPLLFMSLKAFTVFWEKYRDETIFCFVVFFGFFIMLSGSNFWWGGWAWGSRYMYQTVPFLILPVSILLTEENYAKWIRKVKFLFVLGMFIQLPSVLHNNGDYNRFSMKTDIGYSRLYLTQFSPIVSGYYRIVSAVKRQFTGESLDFIISYIPNEDGRQKQYSLDYHSTAYERVTLKGYDNFDLWVTNSFSRIGNVYIKILFALVFLTFISVSVCWYLLLRRFLL